MKASSLDLPDDFALPCGSDRALVASAIAAICLRCGSASDKHSSITPSNVVGLKGFRRQRVALSLSAILGKSGFEAPGPEKAYPEIAIKGIEGAWS